MSKAFRCLLAVLLAVSLAACGVPPGGSLVEHVDNPPPAAAPEGAPSEAAAPVEPPAAPEQSDTPEPPDIGAAPPAEEPPEAPAGEESEENLPDPEGYYYDLEGVVRYLYTYEELPPNYITKAEARDLGWQGGSVERYQAGAAIGGDRFGNREGLLPSQSGRQYTECDLNTNGQSSRGAERLIFSNDGLYFYTADHYESFSQVWVDGDSIVIG